MQRRQAAAAALLALGTAFGIARAEDLKACPRPNLSEVKSTAGLMPEVRALLGVDRPGLGGIADRGEKFNATDDLNDEAPMRRFVLAGIGDRCSVVAIERGGRGYSVELRVFALSGSAWKELRRKTLREVPKSVEELVANAAK